MNLSPSPLQPSRQRPPVHKGEQHPAPPVLQRRHSPRQLELDLRPR